MNIDQIVKRFSEGKSLASLKQALSKGTRSIAVEGLQGSATAILLHALTDAQRPILAIAREGELAAYLQNDLAVLLGDEQVSFFPSLYKKAIRYGHKDLANEVIRSELLELIRDAALPKVIVTYPEALIEGVVEAEAYEAGRLELRVGAQMDRKALREKLWEMGFEEKDYVYAPGDFAVRGSIIDIYSFAAEYPARLDFFDDELESIRLFEPESQLSQEQIGEITILSSFKPEERAGHSLISLLPKDTLIYVDQAAFLPDSLQTTYTTAPIHPEDNQFATLQDLQASLVEPTSLLAEIDEHQCLLTNPKVAEKVVRFGQLPEPIFHKNFDLLSEALLKYQSSGYDTIIMSDQEGQIERLQSIFSEQAKGVVFQPITPTLHSGFIDDTLKIALFTDHSIFERYHNFKLKSDKIRKSRAVMTLKDIQSFEYGDYVVHHNYGIATFGGLFTIAQNGKQKETVRLNFQGGDSVYVSIHSLHHISKYKSKDNEEPPRLSKLGGSAWDNLKERTKKKVKDIARNLIKLYAERLRIEGFAFSKDSYLQKELEASFMYEDTPDQEQATKEVKADMERPIPMDRLICGDVGFGKTEIAIRAAFKAATDGKQVAVLVPTTVLAYQHFRTFSKRLKAFPVRVDYLSQARSAKERKEVLEGLREGKIDIVVGTHTITGKGVEYKDLGLLIIDEEQKFGVAIKERLRELRAHIDTLTMTATPIPRTLQFSLMGARDLSNILTPPPNRYPIRTEHLLYDIDVLAEAINAELARGGQVYFIHNRIHNMNDIARDIAKAVPGIRIAIGHGQMSAKELEKVLLGFVHHETDLLLATTIVENGIDVGNANTIIINDAHRFGLSDLHQLRGRVGRSDRKAYCLLLTPPIEELTPNAKRRMQSITSFSELGSGIHIAMQDLDIRGAGNLLGSEQSGFIADLGFETYKRILEEAVMELKDSEFAEELNTLQGDAPQPRDFVYETVVETDAEAYFPQLYVPGDNERITLYRELERLSTSLDIQAYRLRLEDRFGALPQEAEELLKVVELRLLGKRSGIERVVQKQGLLKLYLVSDLNSSYYRSAVFSRILANATAWGRELRFKEEQGRRSISVKGITTVTQAYHIVEKLVQ
ncbi:transcription-repair coupling factor [Porphyromonas levii]|uniref:transcription-repair coupling factor n=1 Tax=Porphyromonas levii TaxID=28114 RepID=UPI001BADC663|nr:transcription-repair coupling factor [Porphyromonas levii]MBR8702857.1 Transcription-repair-coupling factor [Porphyromonas levii]